MSVIGDGAAPNRSESFMKYIVHCVLLLLFPFFHLPFTGKGFAFSGSGLFMERVVLFFCICLSQKMALISKELNRSLFLFCLHSSFAGDGAVINGLRK